MRWLAMNVRDFRRAHDFASPNLCNKSVAIITLEVYKSANWCSRHPCILHSSLLLNNRMAGNSSGRNSSISVRVASVPVACNFILSRGNIKEDFDIADVIPQLIFHSHYHKSSLSSANCALNQPESSYFYIEACLLNEKSTKAIQRQPLLNGSELYSARNIRSPQ